MHQPDHISNQELGRAARLAMGLLMALAIVGAPATLLAGTDSENSGAAQEEAPPETRSIQDEWAEESWGDEDWAEEDWDEEEPGLGRSFLYKELVVSIFYSPEGKAGVPPDDPSRDHFDLSHRPPGSYAGLDWVATFSPDSPINKALFPDWLPLRAFDLHPRVVYDQMEARDGFEKLKFAPQDFWLRFNPGEQDRLTLRIGQFVIPYGASPPLAPRQMFILPIEATDLGLKWDWGVDLKGPIGEYDWEIAATIGSGEALHSPHLFEGDERSSYLITGRIGAPTYWDFQYGASFLFGDLPTIMGPDVFGDAAISRWRVATDVFYKYGTYLMFGGQVSYGQDGFDGDEMYVMVSGGKQTDVLGYRAWIDWVLPMDTDFRLRGQFESVIRDLSTSGTDDSAAILELSYSLTTSVTLTLDYRVETNRWMGNENDALYFGFTYYGF